MKHERIFLTGMTFAGKTTVGAILARMMEWQFIDVDLEIARRQGMSVPEIFEDGGEAVFRSIEYQVISELNDPGTVIATGAGAPVNGNLMKVMCRSGFVVFIDVPIEVLADRVRAGGGDRPLLAGLDGEELLDRLQGMYDQRIDAYRQAHHVVSGISGSAEVAAQIFTTLRVD